MGGYGMVSLPLVPGLGGSIKFEKASLGYLPTREALAVIKPFSS